MFGCDRLAVMELSFKMEKTDSQLCKGSRFVKICRPRKEASGIDPACVWSRALVTCIPALLLRDENFVIFLRHIFQQTSYLGPTLTFRTISYQQLQQEADTAESIVLLGIGHTRLINK